MRDDRRTRDVQHTTRTVVAGLLIGALVFSAGCSGALSGDEVSHGLKLVNQDQTNHAVVVEISDETGVVYSDSRTIDAESDLDLARFNGTGEYEVRVTVDGDSTALTHTFETDGGPIRVTNIGIDNQGAVTVE